MSILTTNAGVSVGNKPSVLDLIKLQGAWDTPLFSSFKSGKAAQINHSWITDTLRAYGTNAQLEVSNTTDYSAGSKVLHTNTMQIFTTDVKVSMSQQATATYGAKSLQHELMKGAKEHAMDIEYSLLGLQNQTQADVTHATANLGLFGGYTARVANTTAGKMAGIFSFIPRANRIGTTDGASAAVDYVVGTSGVTLTYDLFQSILEPIWAAGGEAKTVYVGSALKKKINSFDSGNTQVSRVINDSNNYDPRVTKISTDFGIVDVRLSRFFKAGSGLERTILAGDFSTCTVRNLIPTKLEPVSTSDTATVKRYYTECTLEVLNPDLIACGMNFV
jgi:hypothetical protein